MADPVSALNGLPLLVLMLVIAAGYSLGRLAVGGVSLGPAGATLFVALALGHLGFEGGAAGAGSLGFALFIYSVGFDAAPHLPASLRERRGWRFVGVGALVNLLALGAALACAWGLGIDASTAAGLLAGALTSAPTYAAASELAPDPARLSLAFAITFPFGLTSLVLLIQLLPRLMRDDLARDTASDEEIRDPLGRSGGGGAQVSRAFVVRQEEVIGRPLRELDLIRRTGCVLARVQAGEAVLIPDGDTVLEDGDRVLATGRLEELQALSQCLGPEVGDAHFESPHLVSRRIQLRAPEAVGRSLEQLAIIQGHHCVVTRIDRASLSIEPDPQVVLAREDVLTVVGRREDLRDLARRLGRFAPTLGETDIAVYAGGIALGLGLGALRLPLFGASLGLGTAGGLLLVGLLLGGRSRIGPFRTHVPREARQLVRDLGILLFVGETGLRAGAGVAEALQAAPWQTFAAGAVVNVVAVAGALAVARGLLAMRPVDAWGSVCGGLTSSAALHAVRRASDSNEAAIAYAAAYAVASVLAALAGPVVVLLLR